MADAEGQEKLSSGHDHLLVNQARVAYQKRLLRAEFEQTIQPSSCSKIYRQELVRSVLPCSGERHQEFDAVACPILCLSWPRMASAKNEDNSYVQHSFTNDLTHGAASLLVVSRVAVPLWFHRRNESKNRDTLFAWTEFLVLQMGVQCMIA